MSKKPAGPPKGADTGPVRRSAGQKPRGNPKKSKTGIFGNWQDRRKTGRVVPT